MDAGEQAVVRGEPAPSFPTRFGRVFGLAAVHWRLALALYLPSALLVLITAAPVLVLGERALAWLGPWLSQATSSGLFALSLGRAQASAARLLPGMAPDAAGATSLLFLAVVVALLGLLLQSLAYTLLCGGVLERLEGGPRSSFRVACLRWFGPMVRFGFPALAVLALPGGLGALVIGLLPLEGGGGTLLRTIAIALWLAYLNALLELARADMVVRDDPDAWRALGRAVSLATRPGLFLHAALLWLFLLSAGALFWSGAARALADAPERALLAGLVAHQVFLLFGAWLKVVRLATAIELARALGPSSQPAS